MYLYIPHSRSNPYTASLSSEKKEERKEGKKGEVKAGRSTRVVGNGSRIERSSHGHPSRATHPALLSEVGAHQPAILRGVEDVPTGGALSAGTFPS